MMTKTPTCLTVRACLRFVGSLVLRVFVGWSSSLIRAALLWCCAWQKVLLRTNFLVDVPLFWRFDVSPLQIPPDRVFCMSGFSFVCVFLFTKFQFGSTCRACFVACLDEHKFLYYLRKRGTAEGKFWLAREGYLLLAVPNDSLVPIVVAVLFCFFFDFIREQIFSCCFFRCQL